MSGGPAKPKSGEMDVASTRRDQARASLVDLTDLHIDLVVAEVGESLGEFPPRRILNCNDASGAVRRLMKLNLQL